MRRLLLTAAALVAWTALVSAQIIQPGQQASLGAANAVAIVSVAGETTLTVQIQGTWTGTLSFESSLNGSAFTTTNCTPINGTSAVTTTTATGVWSCGVIGLNFVQVRFSSYGSGTASVLYNTAYVAGSGGGSGGGSSTVTINDPSVTSQKAAVNASGQLSITCANCSGSGASAVDNSAFTASATSGAPAMGFFHSTIDTVTDGRAAVLAMDSKRNLFNVIRDAAGNARGVNVSAGNALIVDGSAATQPVSGTFWQATQPVSGTFWQATQPVSGTFWQATQPISAASLPLPALAATSTKQSDGTQKTQIVDGSGNVIASTTNNLNVQCANCSGSGVSAVDEAAFTAATTVFAAGGGFFQTTATNNALTTGQQGAFQVTANRALFSNLRNAAGTEVGTSTTPLQVTLANTGANSNKLLVTPDSIALPANQSVNVSQLAGTTTDTNSGTKSAGTLRVVLATDQPALTNKLLVTPDSVALPANQSVNVNQIVGTTADVNSGTKSAGTLRVVLATDQPTLTNKLLVTPDSVALPANQSINVSQINGVTPLMGAGATGTGALRTNGVSESATGAAPPASAAYIGGLQSGATGGFLGGVPVCDTFKAVSMTSATTTLMVTGVSGRHVRICSVNLVTAIANNVVLISGTGATCGTGTAGIMGGTTAANGWNFAANGGIALGSGLGTVMQTAATGDSVCIITSAAGPLAGTIAYTIF